MTSNKHDHRLYSQSLLFKSSPKQKGRECAVFKYWQKGGGGGALNRAGSGVLIRLPRALLTYKTVISELLLLSSW